MRLPKPIQFEEKKEKSINSKKQNRKLTNRYTIEFLYKNYEISISVGIISGIITIIIYFFSNDYAYSFLSLFSIGLLVFAGYWSIIYSYYFKNNDFDESFYKCIEKEKLDDIKNYKCDKLFFKLLAIILIYIVTSVLIFLIIFLIIFLFIIYSILYILYYLCLLSLIVSVISKLFSK